MFIAANLVTGWQSVEVVSLATSMMCAACSARQHAPAGLWALSTAMLITLVRGASLTFLTCNRLYCLNTVDNLIFAIGISTPQVYYCMVVVT